VNLILWIVASILSLMFLASGAVKLARSRDALVAGGYTWAATVSDSLVKSIGLLEILGAAGLVLPGAFDIATPLVPAAGTGLAVLMLAAAALHVSQGESKEASVPIVLAALAAFVAIMRFSAYTL